MPRYDFTTQAESDLESITELTQKPWGQRQTDFYLDGLEELLQTLAGCPGLGTSCGAAIKGVASFPYRSHILYFTQHAQGITIIRILHKRTDSKRHLPP